MQSFRSTSSNYVFTGKASMSLFTEIGKMPLMVPTYSPNNLFILLGIIISWRYVGLRSGCDL
ncbi:uncharacterized protein METZ01_LOCUS40496 [marine metagenome]|uniref:Uncharacterized protein n=1 Tax=marine metagenome TaxID=408172 RepID=A0A381R7J7_9ZZZZ